MNAKKDQNIMGGAQISAEPPVTPNQEGVVNGQTSGGAGMSAETPKPNASQPESPPKSGTTQRTYRTRMQMEKDMLEIGELSSAGRSHQEIAAILTKTRGYSVSEDMVDYNLRKLHAKLAPKREEEFEELKRHMLQNILELRMEAMEAWKKSQENALTQTGIKVGKEIIRTVLRQQQRDGDPRFLRQLIDLLDRQMKIEGMIAPSKLDAPGKNGHAPAGANGAAVLGASNDKPSSNEPSCEKSE